MEGLEDFDEVYGLSANSGLGSVLLPTVVMQKTILNFRCLSN